MTLVLGPRQQPLAHRFGVTRSRDGNAARFALFLSSNPLGARAISAVRDLNDQLPSLLRQVGLARSRALIAGDTALSADTVDDTVQDLGRVTPAALAAIFVVIALFLRALVAPAYLVLTSALAALASLGLTVYVIQLLLGTGQLTYYVVFTVAVLLVSLGSDYNVFLVGRIWQEGRRRALRDAVEVAGQPGRLPDHRGRAGPRAVLRAAGDRAGAIVSGDRLRDGGRSRDRRVRRADAAGPRPADTRRSSQRLAGARAGPTKDRRSRIGRRGRARVRLPSSASLVRDGTPVISTSVQALRVRARERRYGLLLVPSALATGLAVLGVVLGSAERHAGTRGFDLVLGGDAATVEHGMPEQRQPERSRFGAIGCRERGGDTNHWHEASVASVTYAYLQVKVLAIRIAPLEPVAWPFRMASASSMA